MDEQEKWNRRYRDMPTCRPDAALVLQQYRHLLPFTGDALDLASGPGGNALLLAGHGLETYAWDISPVALQRLQAEASARRLAIHTEARDITTRPPPAASFDVIVVSRFLDRGLCPAIAEALRPGGLLFYQTFTRERTTTTGPRNPAYLLEANELLSLFSALRVIAYREEGTIGDTDQGVRNEALLVAQREP